MHYNYIIQGLIYNSLNDDIAVFLHEKGFRNEKRSFKLFSFSRLQGDFILDKEKGKIKFKEPISLTISSPFKEFCSSLATGLLTNESVRIGNNQAEVIETIMENEIIKDNEIKIQTLSPIVVYSTFLRPDGRKYTCYFQPGEADYDELLSNNLKKKYKAFYKKDPPTGDVKIQALNQSKLSIINYKGIVIKGYSGRFILSGPVPLLQMAVDGGLGSKNSQGFGCIQVIK